MDKLLFLTNELINPNLYKQMHIPLSLISYGITKGKMYTHHGDRHKTFITLPVNKVWGNDVIYGALFLCKDFDFYSRILDAYHVCSMTTMYRNHKLDLHHRGVVNVSPIHFDTLDDLARLRYREGNIINAETYLGNTQHPKISQRFKNPSYRLLSGIHGEGFKQLFWEVENEGN